jgi:hypothetical protein
MGLGLLAIQIYAFSCFTFWPPQTPLFEGPRNGRFGIPAYVKEELHAGFIRRKFDEPFASSEGAAALALSINC